MLQATATLFAHPRPVAARDSSAHTPSLGRRVPVVTGDLVFLDENDKVLAIENWKTSLQRYLAYCETHGIEPKDLTAFA
jgi:hypothetical protein